MKDTFKRAFSLSIVLLILCGLVYPLAITGISHVLFNKKANGSIVMDNGREVGSELIGQNFTDLRFFRGRVSEINYNTYSKGDKIPDSNGNTAYNGVRSGSGNLGPSNKVLTDRVIKDINYFLKDHTELRKEDIPADLLTSSASGLDPHISLQAARIQVRTVSDASGISVNDLNKIIQRHTERKAFGIFGETGVNVLMVNLEISDILKQKGTL
jgi:K+-transporting ATPase ATPase C chain